MTSLAGRVVIVTGGARGIGLATVTALAKAGAYVAVADLDGELAEAEASRIAAETLAVSDAGTGLGSGGTAAGFTVDVTDAASFTQLLDDVEHRFGEISVLVNNAGVLSLSPFDAEADAVTRRLVDVNLVGVLTGSKLALQRMLPRRSGHVINVCSTLGRHGLAGAVTYSAVSFAVVGLCEALGREVRGSGVAVTAVLPTMVASEMAAGVRSNRSVFPIPAEAVAEAIVRAVSTRRSEVWVPKGRGGRHAILSLLPSAARSYVTRVSGVERVLLQPDRAARQAYERRALGGRADPGA